MAEKNSQRCVIVCASPDADAEYIRRFVRPDDYLIAADGGMNILNTAGIIPDLFVGDFDSFSGSVPNGTELIRLNVRKDDTDSMRCASIAVERGFKELVLLGAMGGTASHTFSNYAVLSFLADNGVNAIMSDKYEDVRVLSEGEYSFANLNGSEFSVFPFGCDSVVVSYTGESDYPAKELKLPENSSLGKSNVFRSDDVKIAVNKGKAIIFSSKTCKSITKL